MKSYILNVRIPEKLRNMLIDDSDQKGVSLSDNVRDILTTYSEELQSEEIDNQTLFDNNYPNSNEFIYLISWIYEKSRDPYNWGLKNDLEDLKKIVLEVIKNDCFPNDLKREFEKVLLDILRLISEFGTGNNQFRFCELCSNDAFDYVILRDYINNRAFENRIYV
ncbi:hypothetical protein [Flavobacterium sp. ZE23DGlu08]|uniref:hypothetical protein n=1 Tax=Flavobacterium sp. ZE23DGlu08 TaxID=3059026 RepID=UPI00265DABF4|nr:hypothetical protein [Flavobacterium sp. ZE23DGlu08]WKL44894.1 hypothetical protein Q1W72_04605 [Flavobacterium sp. ZE23DGlu08]